MALVTFSAAGGSLSISGDRAYQRAADLRLRDGAPAPTLVSSWSAEQGALRVRSDRLGMLPLFHGSIGGRLTISDSLAELVRHARRSELDADALSVFLRIGFFVGHDTPFAGVKVLPPGLDAELNRADNSIPVDPGPPALAARDLPQDEAIATYAELFGRAVRDRIPEHGTVGLPLSGGRDSRHILFDLLAAGRAPGFAITHDGGPKNYADWIVAKELCAAFGIRHVVMRPPALPLIELERKKNRATHFLSDEHAWFQPVVTALEREAPAAAFDGLGGDVLSNGLFYDPELVAAIDADDPGRMAERLLAKNRDLPYLSPAWQERFSWERARARLAGEIARHLPAPNPIASFFFWNRTRREVSLAPFVLASPIPVATPYLDPELLDFFLGLPLDPYGVPGFHDRVIERTFPQHARFRYSSDVRASEIAGSAGMLGAAERLRYAAAVTTIAARPFANGRNCVARLPRVVADATCPDRWWMDRLVYLDGLLRLPGG